MFFINRKRVSCVKQTKDDMRRNSSTKSLMDKYTLTKVMLFLIFVSKRIFNIYKTATRQSA